MDALLEQCVSLVELAALLDFNLVVRHGGFGRAARAQAIKE